MVEIIVVLITSIASIITVVINKSTSKKVETIEEIKKDINKVRYENDKTFLTNFLSEVENEEKKSPIQIKRAYEVYEEYTELNGNSYVHDKWDELIRKGKL